MSSSDVRTIFREIKKHRSSSSHHALLRTIRRAFQQCLSLLSIAEQVQLHQIAAEAHQHASGPSAVERSYRKAFGLLSSLPPSETQLKESLLSSISSYYATQPADTLTPDQNDFLYVVYNSILHLCESEMKSQAHSCPEEGEVEQEGESGAQGGRNRNRSSRRRRRLGRIRRKLVGVVNSLEEIVSRMRQAGDSEELRNRHIGLLRQIVCPEDLQESGGKRTRKAAMVRFVTAEKLVLIVMNSPLSVITRVKSEYWEDLSDDDVALLTDLRTSFEVSQDFLAKIIDRLVREKTLQSLDVVEDERTPSATMTTTRRSKKKKGKRPTQELERVFERRYDLFRHQFAFLSALEQRTIYVERVQPRIQEKIDERIREKFRRRDSKKARRRNDVERKRQLRGRRSRGGSERDQKHRDAVLEEAEAPLPEVRESDVMNPDERAKLRFELMEKETSAYVRQSDLPVDDCFAGFVDFVDQVRRRDLAMLPPIHSDIFEVRVRRCIRQGMPRSPLLNEIRRALQYGVSLWLMKQLVRFWEENKDDDELNQFVKLVKDQLFYLYPYDMYAQALAGEKLCSFPTSEHDDDRVFREKLATGYIEVGNKALKVFCRSIDAYVAICPIYFRQKMPKKVRSLALEGLNCIEERIRHLQETRTDDCSHCFRSQRAQLTLFAACAAFKLSSTVESRSLLLPLVQESSDLTPEIHETALYYLGRIDQDRSKFEEVIQMSRGSNYEVKSLISCAQLYAKEKQLDEAESSLRRSMTLSPANSAVHSLLGYILFEKKEFDIAYEHLAESVRLKPDGHPRNFRLLGAYYDTISPNEDRCVRCFRKAVLMDPLDSLSGARLVDLLMKRGVHEERVFSLLKKVVFQNSRANWASKRLGFGCLSLEKYQESQEYFQMTIRGEGSDFECWEGLGDAYFHQGKFVSALRCFQRAYEISRRDTGKERLFASYRIAFIKGLVFAEYDDSEKIFSLLVSRMSRSDAPESSKRLLPVVLQSFAQQYYRQAQESYNSGLYESSSKYLVKALEVLRKNSIRPEDSGKRTLDKLQANILSFHFCLRASLPGRAAGCLEHALGMYRLLVDEDDQDHFVLRDLCLSLLQNYVVSRGSSLLEEAIRMCKKSIQLGPRDSSRWNLLGVAFHFAGDLEKRRRCHIHAVELDRRNSQSWSLLGWAYMGENDWVRAKRSFQISKNLDPKRNFAAFSGLAYVDEVRELLPSALDNYFVALDINDGLPFSATRAANLAIRLRDTRRLAGLIDILKKLKGRLAVGGILCLSSALESIGDLAGAEEVIVEAIRSRAHVSSQSMLLASLGRVYLRMGNFEKSLAVFRQANKGSEEEGGSPSLDVVIGIGIALCQTESEGDLSSIEFLRSSVHAESEAVRVLIPRILCFHGKNETALRFVEKLIMDEVESENPSQQLGHLRVALTQSLEGVDRSNEALLSLESVKIERGEFSEALEIHQERLGVLYPSSIQPRESRRYCPHPQSPIELCLAERTGVSSNAISRMLIEECLEVLSGELIVDTTILLARSRLLFVAGSLNGVLLPSVNRTVLHEESLRLARRVAYFEPTSLSARRLVLMNLANLHPCEEVTLKLLKDHVEAFPSDDYVLSLFAHSLILCGGRVSEADSMLQQVHQKNVEDALFLRCLLRVHEGKSMAEDGDPTFLPARFWLNLTNTFALSPSLSESEFFLRAAERCAGVLSQTPSTTNPQKTRIAALAFMAYFSLCRRDFSQAMRHIEMAFSENDEADGVCLTVLYFLRGAALQDGADVGERVFQDFQQAKDRCPTLSWFDLYFFREDVLRSNIESNCFVAVEALSMYQSDHERSRSEDWLQIARNCFNRAMELVSQDDTDSRMFELGQEIVRLERARVEEQEVIPVVDGEEVREGEGDVGRKRGGKSRTRGGGCGRRRRGKN